MEILKSPLLESQTWLEHGFGTRHAPLSQEGMASLKQIHSSESHVAEGPGPSPNSGDALLAGRPGLTVSVRTADCYPVLLADPVNHTVAAIHAGWRGTEARIVQRAIEQMQREFGSRPDRLIAAIGPGIGVCCYYVGEDVARRFGMLAAGHLDLAAENLRQLLEAGVPRESIDVLQMCTYCDSDRFHSYRRDKESAGRMISFIGAHR